MRVLAVIPARGGSKGLPRKNLLLLAGEPLLVHTIRAAEAAPSLDRVVVSTDDDEIADIAQAAGAQVIRRPAELAQDDSPTEDAVIHALESLDERPGLVVTLEPTSPLRSARLIEECIHAAVVNEGTSVVTVTEDRSVFGRIEGGRFRHLQPGQPRLRQLREPLYRESSTVYVTPTERLLADRSVVAGPLVAVVVSEEEAVDVNTELDLVFAEALLARRNGPA